MLIELYGQNFGCFRNEFRLSMLATNIDPSSHRGIIEAPIDGEQEPLKLLRAVAIYGPNASGKSTVIRAARALRYLIGSTHRLRSDKELVPYEPYALTNEREPVRLGIKAVIDRRVYDYEVSFDRSHFQSERLVCLNAGRKGVLLDRQDRRATGEWLRDERFSLLAKDFRTNALLLSLADRLAPSLARNISRGLLRLLQRLDTPVEFPWFMSRNSSIAKRVKTDGDFGKWLLSQLKSADIGVENYRADETKVMVRINPGDDTGETDDSGVKGEEHADFHMTLYHRGSDGVFAIPYHRESAGTRRFIDMASLLYDLARGPEPGVLFIDEIDQSLHPTLLQGIINHFNSEIPMKSLRGQLVFVTHETALLDAEARNAVMRRDQVYLTEKDAAGAARLYSVAEFKERNNLNIKRRYLQGRYGAIPSLGAFEE